MKTLITVIFLIASIGLTAQTLVQSTTEPSIGEVDKNYRIDTSAYPNGLPNNVTGNGVVWDFTKMLGSFPILFDSILNPSTAPSYSSFPQSTYAMRRGALNTFYKSSTAPSQTELLGFYSPTLTITFTNSAIALIYPVNYGYSNSDVVSGSFKTSSNTGASNGNINVVADGTGTLNLPGGVTFTNVLRVKSVEQLTLTSGLFPLGTINQTIYSYFAPGKKYPVIYCQYNSYQLLAGTPIVTTDINGDFDYFTAVGLRSNSFGKSEFKVSPNPFQDKIQIKGLDVTTEFQLQLFDATGRLIQTAKQVNDIDGRDLPSGVYLLEIKTVSGVYFQKLIKE
jgi:hypothetical protein